MTTSGSPMCSAPRGCAAPGRARAPGSTSAPTRGMTTRPRARPGRPGGISSTSPTAGCHLHPAARRASAPGAGWSKRATPGSTGFAKSWSASRRKWPTMMASWRLRARSSAGAAQGYWDKPLVALRPPGLCRADSVSGVCCLGQPQSACVTALVALRRRGAQNLDRTNIGPVTRSSFPWPEKSRPSGQGAAKPEQPSLDQPGEARPPGANLLSFDNAPPSPDGSSPGTDIPICSSFA